MTTSSLNRVGIIIDGRPYTAEAANAGTALYQINGRQAVASTGPDTVISLVTEALDTELADIATSQRRVRAAADGPYTPRSQRPSALVAARKRAAREHHTAVWQNGYAQAEADSLRRPLPERITVKDVPELIELVLARVLADPELRAEFVKAAEAAEFEQLLDA